MSPKKHETGKKEGGHAGTPLRKMIPKLPTCAKKHLRWGPLTVIPAPGSPDSAVAIPVVRSQPQALTHVPANMVRLGDVQYVGHTSRYHAPTTYPQQPNPWTPHSNLAHGEWSYNVPPEMGMSGGVMRILGGEVVTSVRGVETIIKPEDFLKFSDQERRALITAGYTHQNQSSGPPPPPPPPAALIPPPPPPPPPKAKTVVAKTRVSSITPSESVSAKPTRNEKKCQLCLQAARVPDIDGVKICSACYHYHSYLMAENATKKKPSK